MKLSVVSKKINLFQLQNIDAAISRTEKGNKAKHFYQIARSKAVWLMIHFMQDVLHVVGEVCDGPEYSYKVVDENHNILDSGTRSVSVGSDIPIPLYVHKSVQTELLPEPDIEEDYISDNDYENEQFNENLFEKKKGYRERVEEAEKAYAEFCTFMLEQESR